MHQNLPIIYEYDNSISLSNFSICTLNVMGICRQGQLDHDLLIERVNILRNYILNGENFLNPVRYWRSKVGYVAQDVYLIDDTIKSNIAFGIKDEEFNEINYKNAIKLAQLDRFINSLPNKDNTTVGDRGIRLSGGQRQRIGIARSLYNKPNILIFDEPTSSLDANNEKKIMEDLSKLSNNLTIIIISHRLSVFGKCNKIFEVKNGKILELLKK